MPSPWARRLSGRRAARDALEQYVAHPKAWQGNLEVHLKQAGADRDQAVLDAAAAVMLMADPACGVPNRVIGG